MKRILKLAVLTVVVCCVAGPALADIPEYVDFWAEQTASGTTNVWTIHLDEGETVTTDPLRYNRYGYDLPVWETPNKLRIDNDYVPDNTKELWVEITFTESGKYLAPPKVNAADAYPNGVAITNITPVGTGTTGDLTWSWKIFPQPAVEWVDFSDLVKTGSFSSFAFTDYGNESFQISKIEVGTYCVPTPPAVVLCLIGVAFAGIAGRIRRRK